MKKLVLLVALLAGALALFTVSAATASGAEFQYKSLGALYQLGVDGQLHHQQRIAVNHATGRLYVTDAVNDQIRVFDPTDTGGVEGPSFGAGAVSEPFGVAVDQSTGSIYVADEDHIVKFTSAGELVPGFDLPVTGPVAFDQVDDELVVADVAANVIRHYTPAGDAAGPSFDGSDLADLIPAFAGLQDVAVNSRGDVLVVDSDGDPALGTGTSRVDRYSSSGDHEATFGPVAGAATVGVIPATDEVVVSGNQDAVNRNEMPTVFVFGDDAPDTVVEALPIDPSVIYSTIRGIAVDDGAPARLYLSTDVDVAYAGGGGYGTRSVQVYQRPAPAAPTITQSAAPTYTAADLRGNIDSGLRETAYHFEYGPTDAYGTTSPARSIPAGDLPVEVKLHVAGLASGATYHYRIVASNAEGPATGPDRTFTTLTPPGADICPNAGVRDLQGSAAAPDCRAWEMVSPVDKNGGDAGISVSYWSPAQISLTGDAAAYTSNDAFANSVQSSGNVYTSRRGVDGWTTRAVLPPLRTTTPAGNQNDLSKFFSPDLSKTFVATPTRLTDDSPEGSNLYLRDNLTDRYRLITKYPSNASVLSMSAAGVSTDFSHVLAWSAEPLTPDSPVGAVANLYEWVAGSPDTLRLASILPGEVASPGGAMPGGLNTSGQGSIDHAMSDDGSRVFFNAPAGSANIYLREDGQSTTEITPNGRFWTATPSGSRVLFVERAGAPDAGLRLYDVASHTTLDLSPDDEPADGDDPDVTGVVGASDDLSRVYFVANGRLVAGKGVAGESNLYLSENGHVTFVATGAEISAGDDEFPVTGQRAVTADGRRLAFVSTSRLTDYDNRSRAACPAASGDSRPDGACREVYLYDDTTGELSCPSCSGNPEDSYLVPPIGNQIRSFMTWQRPQNNFSADGSRLYFQSKKALVPQDANGVFDVYQWAGGQARLITSGAGDGGGSGFMGASASGDDVFFTTRDRLVDQDKDGNNDVYDARVGGGFPGPVQADPPCSGEACHGLPAAPAVLPIAGSVTFAGPGNVAGVPRAQSPDVRKAKVSKPKPISGSSGALQIKVPGKGKLSLSGSGVRSTSRTVTKSGTVKVTVTLTKRAVTTLRSKHRVVTTVQVKFTPARGKASTVRVRLTFKRPKAKAKKHPAGHTSNGKGR